MLMTIIETQSMNEARAEVALKFNAIPQVQEIDKGRVELKLTTPNGTVFTIDLKAKTWRKAEKSMQEYAEWVGSVSGKLGAKTDDGFALDGAGIQVFEKKPKEPKPEE